MTLNLREFVKKHTEFLALEREAEIAETNVLIGKVPLKELQRRGVCLLKLHPANQSTGLYGRTLVTFAPSRGHGDGTLPTHNISSGDIVGVSRTHGGRASSTDDPSGIVSRVTPTSITVAFDHKNTEGDITFEHEGIYRLTKLANDVTYKRLKRALNDLESHTSGPASHLVDVLFGEADPSPPSLPSSSSEHSEVRFFNEKLNQSQREAVTFALSQRDIAIIHGPPGTGKTTTVVEIIQQAVQRKLKVLACAPSNVAVDNLAERLAAGKVAIVRLGHPARLLPAVQRYALDAILAASEEAQIVRDVRRDIDQTRVQLSKCKQAGEKRRLRDESRTLRKELLERERHAVKEILQRADVVLATNTSASPTGPLGHLPKDHFDIVVIDECAQALEASCWVPLPYAPRCVLAGDHQQLPPTILSDKAAADGLAISLMERTVSLHADKVTRMLTTQYRMNSAIMMWSSEAMYAGKLTADESVAHHLLKDLTGIEETEDTSAALVLFDTAGCDMSELDLEAESSKGNEGEADLVAAHVERLLDSGLRAADIAVIAPYNLQVELLRLRLNGRHSALEIKSVDGFQGREKEAVVISLVRSNSRGEVGFLAEDRRINVAVTRARRHVAVICDSDTVRHHGFLKELVEYMESNGEVRSAHQYLDEIDISSSQTRRPDHLMFKGGKATPKAADKGSKPRPKETHYQIPDTKTRRTIDPIASSKKEAELTEQVRRFFEDQSRDHMTFPSSLNSHDRLVVHETAEKLGLFHSSSGESKDRHITISKQPIGSGEPAQPSQNAVVESSSTDGANLKVSEVNLDAVVAELRTENPMDAIGDITQNREDMQSHNAEGKNEPANRKASEEEVACQPKSGDKTYPMENLCKLDSEPMHAIGAVGRDPTKVLSHNVKGNLSDKRHREATDARPHQEQKGSAPEKTSGGNLPRSDAEPSVEDTELHRCQFCKKKLPPGNLFLHEIHCEKLAADKQRLKDLLPKSQKKKIDRSKQRNTLENAAADADFDELIAMAVATDNRCNFVKCKEKIALTGVLCAFCNRRYCFGHNMPEVHGCGEMARSHARKVVHREKVVRAGSGVKERKKVDPERRAQLERKLEKKKDEMGEKRTRKSSKKK